MNRVRTILCATDFSPTSEHAVEYARRLAEQLGAELHLLHVAPCATPSVPEDRIMLPTPMLPKADASAASDLERAAKACAAQGTPVATHLAEGSPPTEIVRVAEQAHADLIVLGATGQSGVAHLLLGSVADRVVRASPIPVLTTRLPSG
jgi:nucleotide-binding universal stress UspA family protein